MRFLFFSQFLLFVYMILSISCNPLKKQSALKYKFDFYTEYNQFYLTSDNGDKSIQNTTWSEEAFDDRLDVKENLITVYTGSYGHIRGELFLIDSPNSNFDNSKYDHIVEGGLAINSGELKILDCPTSAVASSFNVKPGNYRVRVYMSDLIDTDEDEGTDYYKIELWPDRVSHQTLMEVELNKVQLLEAKGLYSKEIPVAISTKRSMEKKWLLLRYLCLQVVGIPRFIHTQLLLLKMKRDSSFHLLKPLDQMIITYFQSFIRI